MSIIKAVSTIPELFYYLTEEYGVHAPNKLLYTKINGKYEGISYQDFRTETLKFASGLAALGIKNNDKVAIIAENRPEWMYSDMAILALGAVNVPLYPSLTADSVQFILNNSESKVIIVSNKFQLNKVLKVRDHLPHLNFIIVMNDKDALTEIHNLHSFKSVQEMGILFEKNNPGYVKAESAKIHIDDLCTIIYTSGTTGEPKGVMLSHENILSNVRSALQVLQVGPGDSFLSFLPLCHIFERMAGYYTAFASGSSIYYAESIEAVSQNILEAKPTIMTTVPRLFERIHSKIIKTVESGPVKKQKIFFWAIETGKEFARARRKGAVPVTLQLKQALADKLVFSTLKQKLGGRLRYFVSGGAALPKDIGEFFEAIGVIILEGYGLTESSPVIAVNRLDDYKFGTVGKTFTGVEIKTGPDGEILAKGPNIMKGYYKNKKETEETIKDGWLHTGDIGHFDTEGFLVITDRKKHLFKTSAGKYIAPTPIENLFLASKYIDQFVLIGDKRMFLSALIVPDFDSIRGYADSHKIHYTNNSDLIKRKEIYELLEKDMAQFQKKLANYERVRKFALLDKPFSIETGDLTPSLKIKRKVVEQRYSWLINEMYDEFEK